VRRMPENRPADLKLYITDIARVARATGWSPRRSPRETLGDICHWIRTEEGRVRHMWLE
jgi:CDP-paratose 2-epimerase